MSSKERPNLQPIGIVEAIIGARKERGEAGDFCTAAEWVKARID
jgi:hypothetical protein